MSGSGSQRGKQIDTRFRNRRQTNYNKARPRSRELASVNKKSGHESHLISRRSRTGKDGQHSPQLASPTAAPKNRNGTNKLNSHRQSPCTRSRESRSLSWFQQSWHLISILARQVLTKPSGRYWSSPMLSSSLKRWPCSCRAVEPHAALHSLQLLNGDELRPPASC